MNEEVPERESIRGGEGERFTDKGLNPSRARRYLELVKGGQTPLQAGKRIDRVGKDNGGMRFGDPPRKKEEREYRDPKMDILDIV